MKTSFLEKYLGNIKILPWRSLAIILLVLSGALFRVRAYQDSLSIGTADTNIFIVNCHFPTFSWEFFTSSRPLSVTLLYKLLEPSSGYQLTEVVWAWIGTAPDKVFQSGLDRITLFQSAFSILCWSLLAWTVTLHIRHFAIKIASVLLILTFAYSPQLADWDSVLMSESLSFSLFALLFALSIELFFRVYNERKKVHGLTYLLVGMWVVTFGLWVFSRDSNAYFLLYTLILLLGLLLIPVTRKFLPLKLSAVTSGLLLIIFAFHNQSLRNSERWINPLLNNILKNVLPTPEFLEYFEKKGMPVSNELISFIGSDGNEEGFWKIDPFMDWVRQQGYSTYTLFLIEHPVWSADRLFRNLDGMFVGNRQPYFRGTPVSTPLWMIPIGDILHPRSGWVAWIDLALVVILFFTSSFSNMLLTKKRKGISKDIDIAPANDNEVHGRVGLIIWSLIYMWLFLGEVVLLFVSFHGDALGILRHTLVAVMPLRLTLWTMAMVIIDIGISIGRDNIHGVRRKILTRYFTS